jgi:hypothetical protein
MENIEAPPISYYFAICLEKKIFLYLKTSQLQLKGFS